MGSCCSETTTPSDDSTLSCILSLHPEEWTQKQVLQWLQYACDGELSALMKPFSRQKISGLSFMHLTTDDLKQFGVAQIGLIDQFVHERDKVIYNYNKVLPLTKISHIKCKSLSSHTSHMSMNSTDNILLSPDQIARSIDSSPISSQSRTSYISPRRYTQRLQLNLTPRIKPVPLLKIQRETIYNGACSFAIYSCYEIQQFANYSYMEYHRKVMDGYIHSYCTKTEASSLSKLCCEYYFEENIATLQIAYDTFLILRDVETYTNINSECIATFYGSTLLNEMKRKYFDKYSNCNEIIRGFGQLVQCGLISKYVPHKALHLEGNDVNMFDVDCLYRFNEEKRLLFRKYIDFIHDKLDRNAWRVGTKMEIYSSSLDSWQSGEIYQMDADGYLIVTYRDNDNKFKKKIHKNQEDVIRSTREFIHRRSKWGIASSVEVFSYTQNRWCSGTIVDKLQTEMTSDGPMQDAFGVIYHDTDGGEQQYKKYIDRWSCDIRDIEILSQRLQKYKPGTTVKIYSNTKECWLRGTIKEVIPNQEMVHVSYGPNVEWEKMVHIRSDQMKLVSL